jgi:hypothetical protein
MRSTTTSRANESFLQAFVPKVMFGDPAFCLHTPTAVTTSAPQLDFEPKLSPEPTAWSSLEQEPRPRWSVATRIAFRFCFVYFGLYVFTSQMLPGMLRWPELRIPNLQMLPPMREIVLWVGANVLGISRPIAARMTGSGDKLFDWVHAFSLLLIAALVTVIWSLVRREAAHHERLYKWFRLYVRLAVGTSMLSYGFAKVIPIQMPTLQLTRLVEPFGNFSPMGVLWYSIGASPAYEIFSGCAEVLGGALLLFPRTALLGSLVSVAVMIEVFTLNMTYDVPVKLFSFHMILMCLFLFAPNARRLFDLLILKRTGSLLPEPPLGATNRAQRKSVIAQSVFAVYMLGLGVFGGVQAWKQFGGGAPRSALFGIWDVDQMTIDGQLRPPLLTDSLRWRRVIFQRPTGVTFQRPNDFFAPYGAAIDTTAKTLTITGADTAQKFRLAYQRPTRERLILDGPFEGRTVHMELKYRDPDSFLLRSRGFHWIQESPFNR